MCLPLLSSDVSQALKQLLYCSCARGVILRYMVITIVLKKKTLYQFVNNGSIALCVSLYCNCDMSSTAVRRIGCNHRNMRSTGLTMPYWFHQDNLVLYTYLEYVHEICIPFCCAEFSCGVIYRGWMMSSPVTAVDLINLDVSDLLTGIWKQICIIIVLAHLQWYKNMWSQRFGNNHFFGYINFNWLIIKSIALTDYQEACAV